MTGFYITMFVLPLGIILAAIIMAVKFKTGRDL